MARQRLTDEQLTAIRAERDQANTVIETLVKIFAVPGVTAAHPQLAPFLKALLTNPQVPKITWFSAIRFTGYEPVLMARYPGAEQVVIAMRDACRKASYTPNRVEWSEFRAAVSRGLTHEEWEKLMSQLPELPKRERKQNPAVANATNLTEFLAAQQAQREDDDEDESEQLTPAQQIRLTLQGAEPSKTTAAAPSTLPTFDLHAFIASLGATPPAPAPIVAPVPSLPDLTKVLVTTGNSPIDPRADAKAELRFKLELAKAEGKDVDLLMKFVDSNPEGVRKFAAAKGIAL